MENIFDLFTSANELVAIESELKKLAQRKREIHAEFKARGKNVNIIGKKATIEIRTHQRKVVDNKEIHKHVSRQLLTAHTTKKDITSVNIKPLADSMTIVNELTFDSNYKHRLSNEVIQRAINSGVTFTKI